MIDYIPKPYQEIADKFAYERPFCALMLDMGLGKSAITLTLIKRLLYNFEIFKPLISAPKFVTMETWPAEIAKWSHLSELTYSVIAGTEQERITAIGVNADIYIVSRDNIAWLQRYLGNRWCFDMLVLDESSNYKNQSTKRYRAVKKVKPKLTRLLELTGTPIPNGLKDIWAQIYLLDGGKRLQMFEDNFTMLYFHFVKRLGYGGSLFEINHGAEEIIYDKIKDICLTMKAVDWLDMPKRRDIVRTVVLSDYTEYKAFREEKVLELPEGEITAFNASSLYSKLLQYANGAIYDTDKKWHKVHDEKLDALEEVIEELLGENVIIFYNFKSDVERIQARIKNTVLLKTTDQIKDWNAGKINKMLAHPASTAYGLNLQDGGHYIIWYGVPPSLELFQQAVKRLDRLGQRFTVFNIMLLVKGTPEFKVYRSLLDRSFKQDQLFEALK